MKGKRGIGEKYEQKVCQYLIEQKYILVDKNFRYRHFEIDIIAFKEKVILFVEVKYRASKADFNIYTVISKKQQKNIRDCAEVFVSLHPEYGHCFGRFDVFLVTSNGDAGGDINDIEIQHFKNTF